MNSAARIWTIAMNTLRETVRNKLHHVGRHLGVDLRRHLDEARLVVERAQLPREVQRVDRDAVTTEPGTLIKGHEPKRFFAGSTHNFPDINIHFCEDNFEFVDKGNVDATEDIFH